jgi:isochorismate synthase
METLFARTITLDKIHRLSLDNGISFVSYRLPGTTEPITMLQWINNPLALDDILTLKKHSGFVFAPFDSQSGLSIRIIQPDLIVQGNTFSHPEKRHNYPFDAPGKDIRVNLTGTANHYSTREEFSDQVNYAKKLIAEKTIDKVVISRVFRENKPPNFDSSALFKALDQTYPDAFVFALYIPDTGFWFGASPEPLVLADQKSISTVSLAGTRKYSPGNTEANWGAKETEEQMIVTRYIDQIIKRNNIRQVKKEGPNSYLAGKIEHLRTIFSFPSSELEASLPEFLKELHPTPSVCGLPKDESMSIIRSVEKHRREYYSGILGPLNENGEWDLYVNLRSMKVLHDSLEYYLGAGITKGSDASDEWEETINKMNTLKSIVESLKDS